MSRYEAPEILRSEVYLDVHRNDEGSGERSRWAFFSILLLGSISPSFPMTEVGERFLIRHYIILAPEFMKKLFIRCIIYPAPRKAPFFRTGI
jgi:hypothetical protein